MEQHEYDLYMNQLIRDVRVTILTPCACIKQRRVLFKVPLVSRSFACWGWKHPCCAFSFVHNRITVAPTRLPAAAIVDSW